MNDADLNALADSLGFGAVTVAGLALVIAAYLWPGFFLGLALVVLLAIFLTIAAFILSIVYVFYRDEAVACRSHNRPTAA